MENQNRNEKLIKVGGQEILLRPTFENMAALESKLGSISYLTWKVSRAVSVRTGKNGVEEAVVSKADMPPLTWLAQVIYYCQAAVKPEDPTQKKFSIEQIWNLVQVEGAACMVPIIQFIMRIGNGNALQAEPSETEKKS